MSEEADTPRPADDGEPEGWAGFAAPDDGAGILVPLSAIILKAGEPLAEHARERAMQRYGDYGVAQDILGGNALFALRDDRNARGAIAACLGGIARLTQSRCFVVTATMRGQGIDCLVERLDRHETPPDILGAVRARLSDLLEMPADRIAPGELVTGKKDGHQRQGDGA